jgi:sugar/nucleoside kinase (ribokinase family)
VADPVHETGAGDRFDAGLAYAVGRGWDWTQTLALANACASYYVDTGRSTDRTSLSAWL